MPKRRKPIERELKEDYLSPEQAAKEIGVIRENVQRLVGEGRIVGAFTHRGRTFIPKDFEILPAKGYAKDPGPASGRMRAYMEDWQRRHSKTREDYNREKKEKTERSFEKEKEKWQKDIEELFS